MATSPDSSPLEAEADQPEPTSPGFLIVGIGASAGGLAAIEELLDAGVDAAAAYVIVTHQAAGQPNLLPDLLRKHTALKVVAVRGLVTLEAGSVYLPAPGKYVRLQGTRLESLDPPSGLRLPIDYFFRSLGEQAGRACAGVILSGTGSDGAEGMRAIKAAGGLTLAPDERSAGHAGMPRAAAATGQLDFVLAPRAMHAVLTESARRAAGGDAGADLPEPLVQKVLHLLWQRVGHDFSLYKPNTVRRRIDRRLQVLQIHGVREYLSYLVARPDELDILFHELLIGVTAFFRDPGAFDALSREVFALVQGQPDGYTVRAWVPGCSSGEEAYSVAIALRECVERLDRRITVQVFATDINGRAVDAARAGVYPEGIAADVTPERLARYFETGDGQFRVGKTVRESMIFAAQDLLKDPPFTRLDLISCRNVLIYLKPDLQRKLLPLFHYALKPDGLLLLGTSESVGAADALFSTVDKRWKIFRRRGSASTAPGEGAPA